MSNTRIETIRNLLEQELSPESIDIIDESHKHIGHAGAAGGAGHFKIKVVAEAFAGKRPLACHQLIYAALDSMMQTEIHALSIEIGVPE
jgi:BolA protein